MYKQSSLYYGNPEDFTKRVYYARFGCPTYSDKAVQGHTAHTTGGAEQRQPQLRCWTEVECTRVGLRYGAVRPVAACESIITL